MKRGGLPGGPDDKESACNTRDPGLVSWRREWLPTPVFLPGEFHGQRRMAGYSPWGHKESDTTERLSLPLDSWISFYINRLILYIL